MVDRRLTKQRLMALLRGNAVPLMFLALCALGILGSGKPPMFMLQEAVVRMARNSFTVLSLVIPVIAEIGRAHV